MHFCCILCSFHSQVQVLAGQNGRQVKLYRKPGQKEEVNEQNLKNVLDLHSETLYAVCL